MIVPIPKMSLLMPLRKRTHFTTNALPSMLKRAVRKDHETIISLDRVSMIHEFRRRPEMFGTDKDDWAQALRADTNGQGIVNKWLDSHKNLLSNYNVRVITSPDRSDLWNGGMRWATALNLAVATATNEWILGLVDEDLVFQDRWDELLWAHMQDRDPASTCVLPMMVMPRSDIVVPSQITHEWLEEQRKLVCNQYTFPAPEIAMEGYRFPYARWDEFVQTVKQEGAFEEPCGLRNYGHWVPPLLHRDLILKVGGWPVDDKDGICADLIFDNRLCAAGVQKVIAKDCLIFHTKSFCYWNEETEADWAAIPGRGGCG